MQQGAFAAGAKIFISPLIVGAWAPLQYTREMSSSSTLWQQSTAPSRGWFESSRGVSTLSHAQTAVLVASLSRRWSVVINGLLLMLCRILLDLVEHAACLCRTMANADGRNMGK